ncbi:MAG: ATP phosphoribosyltransferase regulatory subunit, partial [Bacteroidales bacterium]
MAYKPSIPKGTRDFSPEVLGRRNHIFNTIREVYQKYGYLPIETPSMENLETLTGKYGAEGDKLLFRILNSGDFLDGVDRELLKSAESGKISPMIAEKGLRYDLTVPFARYVVQHRNEILFPFKRFQIQPVWRADRPQKGRYREFFQCDADVIGSDALINEMELIQIIDEVFEKLSVRVDIRLNNRKILFGLAEVCGVADHFYGFTVIIDKLDKIGPDKVKEELLALGVEAGNLQLLTKIFEYQADNVAKLELLKKLLASSETGLKGLE